MSADGVHGSSIGVASRRLEIARLMLRARATSGVERTRLENEVVRLSMPVGRQVAGRYARRGVGLDDLEQVAYLGLVKAVRTFDPVRGEDFLSYAVPTLRGELKRHFRDAGWTVRPPRSVQEAQAVVLAAEARLTQELGRHPGPADIASETGLDVMLVRQALGATGLFRPASLDAPWEREVPVADTRDLELVELREAVRPLLAGLGWVDRTMLAMRYVEGRTQADIGRVVGLSQEQVSRRISRLLDDLRSTLDREAGAA
ncbi:sigma-70 family RNA polymerase sigma factor [Nocardioides acrostichi]|uniref:Sigma-70 family RNA polymerase sigma factor n=1 Tax=Nocardioides acrostichi TaxID=2784339 RepID=A0A930V169_9ACTN|nr:sigma-70 family RNA polymerase sigma factor [Nocardioides acrostichi]MBF4161835.1 sigma-70 family RNA polymerase sigma factor [Nocardioides acrostichi]